MPAPFPHHHQTEQARATLEAARQHSLITNALRAPVAVDAKIRPPAVRKAG